MIYVRVPLPSVGKINTVGLGLAVSESDEPDRGLAALYMFLVPGLGKPEAKTLVYLLSDSESLFLTQRPVPYGPMTDAASMRLEHGSILP